MPRRPNNPLTLPSGPCWEIHGRAYDSRVFFLALASLLPDATNLYAEGASIGADVERIFRDHAAAGPYRPRSQVLWTTGVLRQFRCAFGASLLQTLAEAATRHAEPEFCDALFVYRGETVLLEWPKAFSGPIWIAREIPEKRINDLAAALDATYQAL